jgi:hypothetical protein
VDHNVPDFCILWKCYKDANLCFCQIRALTKIYVEYSCKKKKKKPVILHRRDVSKLTRFSFVILIFLSSLRLGENLAKICLWSLVLSLGTTVE